MEVARESGAENVSVKTSGKMIGFGVSESDLIHFTMFHPAIVHSRASEQANRRYQFHQLQLW